MHSIQALMRSCDYIGRTFLSVARSRLGLAVLTLPHGWPGGFERRAQGTGDVNEVSFSAFSSTLEVIKGVNLRVFVKQGS